MEILAIMFWFSVLIFGIGLFFLAKPLADLLFPPRPLKKKSKGYKETWCVKEDPEWER